VHLVRDDNLHGEDCVVLFIVSGLFLFFFVTADRQVPLLSSSQRVFASHPAYVLELEAALLVAGLDNARTGFYC
jgi:hypothetical protein